MQMTAGMTEQPPVHDRRTTRRQTVQDHVDVERGFDARLDP